VRDVFARGVLRSSTISRFASDGASCAQPEISSMIECGVRSLRTSLDGARLSPRGGRTAAPTRRCRIPTLFPQVGGSIFEIDLKSTAHLDRVIVALM
jgi:hypothetical protein